MSYPIPPNSDTLSQVMQNCFHRIHDPQPPPDIESLWFFQSDLNIKQMQTDMCRYNLSGVFAVTKNEDGQNYSLHVYKNSPKNENGLFKFGIDKYDLSNNPDGTINLISADNSITIYHSLEEAIKNGANAFIPYYFLSSLEKEKVYLPGLSTRDMEGYIYQLNMLSSQYNLGMLEDKQRGFPLTTIALRTSSTGALGIYYLYPQRDLDHDKQCWMMNLYRENKSLRSYLENIPTPKTADPNLLTATVAYCGKDDFDSEFKLKKPAYNFTRLIPKEFPCSLEKLNSDFFHIEPNKSYAQILPLLQFRDKVYQLCSTF